MSDLPETQPGAAPAASPDSADPATEVTDSAATVEPADGGYRLAESEPAAEPAPDSPSEPAQSPPPFVTPPPAAAAPPRAESTFQPTHETEDDSIRDDDFPIELSAVDEVWGRWAEWQEPLLWTGAAIGLVLFIELVRPWGTTLVLLAGLAYGLYYVVIGLEVPVRVTAEQAVREFYAALGHRLPNYRRMFCLLTTDAKHTPEFGGFAGFRAYWQRQLARLAKTPTWLKPLEFRVEACTSRYNPEKTVAVVRYKLQVLARGAGNAAEPLAEFSMKGTAAKGPDGQWYLNDALLPDSK